MEQKRIAIIQNHSPYDRQAYLLGEVKQELEQIGYVTDLLNYDYYNDEGDFTDFLVEKIEKPDYDLVITMDLTGFERRLLEDETFYNQLYCPMVNIISKDAWYFSQYLGQRLNFNMFFYAMQESNVRYVKKMFPNFPNIDEISGKGSFVSDGKPFEQREIDVYFPTTYESCEEIMNTILQMPEIIQKMELYLINEMLKKNATNLYDEIILYFEKIKFSYSTEEFVDVINELQIVQKYIKMYYVEKCVNTMAQCGIQVTVSGQGWKNFIQKEGTKIKVLGENGLSYKETLSTMGNSKIVFSTQQHKGKSVHERVSNAILNGAIAFTDTFPIEHKDQKGVVPYDIHQIEKLPDLILKTLEEGYGKEEINRKDDYFSSAVAKIVESCFS